MLQLNIRFALLSSLAVFGVHGLQQGWAGRGGFDQRNPAPNQDEASRVTPSGGASFLDRRGALWVGAGLFTSGGFLSISPTYAEEGTAQEITRVEEVVRVPVCAKDGSNCVSTTAIKQLDLYMPPWTYPDDMSDAEVLARLKGTITTIESSAKVEDERSNFLKVRVSRGFSEDEIQFVVNSADKVVTFTSKQVDGPDAPDFGGNRKRLDDIRKRTGIFGLMGENFASADTQPREGAFGQLKAFYGLGSGKGFEDVVLDNE